MTGKWTWLFTENTLDGQERYAVGFWDTKREADEWLVSDEAEAVVDPSHERELIYVNDVTTLLWAASLDPNDPAMWPEDAEPEGQSLAEVVEG